MTTRATTSLPGFNAPAIGFEQPFEMLQACHERVRRSLGLLERIVAHVDALGHDAQSRAAAGDVLRYFDQAAPQHHEDEERHVFPALAGQSEQAVRAAVRQLQADHVRMHALWSRLRRVLLRWQDADPPPVSAAERGLIAEFAACYPPHIALEESLVYPAARALFDAAALDHAGREMAARRRAA
jgi:hemerythrin-like domain-containing protein